MGLIPPESLEEIRAKLDIVELVSEHVPGLQRAGRNMKGRCPFHQERTPSFIVSPERQTYHCFGCGEGGDAFSFVMKLEGLGFMEAVEKLAERVGVNLVKAEALGPEQKERLKLKEVLEWARGFFHELLLKDPAAEPARRYFASRHVSAASVEAFSLGFAPRQSSLISAAAKKGFGAELLIKAGLAANREGRLREYFFDRVLFPIRDPKGAVVAFGGRTMGDGQPKYLNSPENPLFSKSRVLYGLPEGDGEVRKKRHALLMEGYMDVIAAHQHGLKTACAPLGTALTLEHVGLLKRYTDSVTIVFDADSAGLNAAVRGAELLLAQGLGVRIATVPQGKDPDEHLHAHGRPAFEAECLGRAVDLVEFKTNLLLSREPKPLSPQSKANVAKQVLATITQCPDEILKEEWTKKLAAKLDVSVDSLRREGGKVRAEPRHAPVTAQRPLPPPPAPRLDVKMGPDEKQLLELLLKRPELSKHARQDDFTNPLAAKIWKVLVSLEPWDGKWESRLLEALDDAAKAAASALLVSEFLISEVETTPEIVSDALERLRRRNRLAGFEQLKREGKLDASGEVEYAKLLVESKRSTARR